MKTHLILALIAIVLLACILSGEGHKHRKKRNHLNEIIKRRHAKKKAKLDRIDIDLDTLENAEVEAVIEPRRGVRRRRRTTTKAPVFVNGTTAVPVKVNTTTTVPTTLAP